MEIGVSVDWATGPGSDQNAFSSDAEIDRFDSTEEEASYQAKWEASYRHASGVTPSGRVGGYDGSTFRYEFVGTGTGGPFSSLFIAFRRSTYVFTGGRRVLPATDHVVDDGTDRRGAVPPLAS
jgi:hypothetical protein